jgi:hypothetical protein
LSTTLTDQPWPRRLLTLLVAAALGTLMLVVVPAGPAEAHIPAGPCTADYEGIRQIQFMNDGTDDFIVWECTKTVTVAGRPDFYYWRASEFDNIEAHLEAVKKGIVRYTKDGVWQGIVTGGFGVFQASSRDRAHTRYEAAFDIRHWSGAPATREIGVHMVADHLVGGSWERCGDTGWKNSTGSKMSYGFYKLHSTCGGTIRLQYRAHFLQHSTNTWWTSPWRTAGPYSIIGV